MPLSDPAPRDPVHVRHVVCSGFRRGDGMWDIEGHLRDTKSYDFTSQYRGAVPSGVPIHEMWIRLTVDDELVIRDIEAVTDYSPFPICPAIAPNFKRLIGLDIRPGFYLKVKEILGGIEGCTHLVEMLGPIGTTAYQTIYPYRNRLRQERGEPRFDGANKPRFLDTCHGWSSSGEIVKQLYPQHYTGE
jgi:hypothetical protein